MLTLRNAKKRPGHEPRREIDLSALHEDVVAGLSLMLKLIDHDLSKPQFAKWQKCIAEQMRRACGRIGIRPLSLYSFRHVAIASWAAAGLSPAEIARLCGHISIRTAHTHYARAGVGHRRRAVVRAVVARALDQVPTDSEAARQAAALPDLGKVIFDFEDMPAARPVTDDGIAALSSEAIAAGLNRHVDRPRRR